MTIFYATSEEGKLKMNEYTAARFRQHLKENDGMRYQVRPMLPESKNMRGYLEGGLIPMFCYFQENLDHRNPEHHDYAREYLKEHLNGLPVVIDGRSVIVGGSTKGRDALTKFVERVSDMLVDDYGCPREAIDPEAYKNWRDTIRPSGGPDNWIDHLKNIHIL